MVSTIRSLRSLLDHLSRPGRQARASGFETLAGARSSTTEEPRRTHEPEPATATTGSVAERPEAERRRRDATATPRLRKPRLLDNSDLPTSQITWFRDARWRSLLNHRRALCGLDYPLASLAARPPFTSRPSGASEWFRCARRARSQPPKNRDGPTNQNQRPQPQDLEPSDRKPNEGVGTPPQPHAYGNHDSSITQSQPTSQITWFRDARWRSLLNHRRAGRCVVSTIRSLRSLLDHLPGAGRQTRVGRPVGCGVVSAGVGGGGADSGHEGRRGVQAAGGGMCGSRVAHVRRAARTASPTTSTGTGRRRRVLRGHEDDPGPSALALRLLGSVHRLVLERTGRRAGGVLPERRRSLERARTGCRAFIALLDRDREAVRAWLDRPPQTNEVGRATALMGGLLHLPEALRGPRAALRDRLLGRAEPAGRPVQLRRLDRQPVRRRALTGPPRPAWRGDHLTPWPDLEFARRPGAT